MSETETPKQASADSIIEHHIPWWAISRRIAKRELDRKAAYIALQAEMADGPSFTKPLSEFFPDPDDQIAAFIRYYDYARKEVDREDGITFSRLNITLTFQAFLLGATAFLFSGLTSLTSKLATPLMSETVSEQYLVTFILIFSGLAAMIIIAAVGWAIAYYSFHGIKSSRQSLAWAKDMWILFNRKNGHLYPSVVPQLTRYSMLLRTDKRAKDKGTNFALAIPSILFWFWPTLLVVWVSVVVLLAFQFEAVLRTTL